MTWMAYMRRTERDLPNEMQNTKSVCQGRMTSDVKSGRVSTGMNPKLTRMEKMEVVVGMRWSSVRPQTRIRTPHQRMKTSCHQPNRPNASDLTSRRYPGRRHDY